MRSVGLHSVEALESFHACKMCGMLAKCSLFVLQLIHFVENFEIRPYMHTRICWIHAVMHMSLNIKYSTPTQQNWHDHLCMSVSRSEITYVWFDMYTTIYQILYLYSREKSAAEVVQNGQRWDSKRNHDTIQKLNMTSYLSKQVSEFQIHSLNAASCNLWIMK